MGANPVKRAHMQLCYSPKDRQPNAENGDVFYDTICSLPEVHHAL